MKGTQQESPKFSAPNGFGIFHRCMRKEWTWIQDRRKDTQLDVSTSQLMRMACLHKKKHQQTEQSYCFKSFGCTSLVPNKSSIPVKNRCFTHPSNLLLSSAATSGPPKREERCHSLPCWAVIENAGQEAKKRINWKLTWNRNLEALEDDFPFQTGDF